MSAEPPREATAAPDPGPAIRPWDEHNRVLISHVRPPGWVNPTPRERYHLVVVGAGTGGLVSAAIAAGLGAGVALIEKEWMGGDCLNVGCVPSKALLRAARARAAAGYGAGPPSPAAADFTAAMERVRRIRAEISPHDGADRFRQMGVDVFFGHARFTSGDRVSVGGAELRFRRAIVATGARPAVPPIPGLDDVEFLTNRTVFELTELPRTLLVLGAGPIGVELGQAFARFGCRVTLVDAAEQVLPAFEPEASAVILRALERDGVRFVGGATVERVTRAADGVELRARAADEWLELGAERLLVCTGRAANVENLGLEAAGVGFGPAGITVDRRLRTTNRRVFAVGDVTAGPRFTHVADAHARIAIRNALFWGRERADRLVIPMCTYTAPEAAHVGISAAEAERDPGRVETISLPIDAVDRPKLDGERDGILALRLERRSGRLLGATLVHPHAGEIIGIAAQAITNELTLEQVGRTIFPYPTGSEIFRRAADLRRRERLTPRARAVFGAFFRLFR
jgi:pyruvate/2-oxoglutarate dehydrogenase complex dihydrolipoamide dehydrogenase (E3) component